MASNDGPRFIVGMGDAFLYFAEQFRAVLDRLDGMEERLMALSQAEQAGLDALKAKIDAFGVGAQETQRVLTAEVARLQDLLQTAVADDAADATMIATLETSIDNLTAAAQAHETDVVNAFADASDDFAKFGV